MGPSDLSQEILDVIPPAMRDIRGQMRGLAAPELSTSHFRILARLYLQSHTNKQLADWIGIAAPTMTRTIDLLERRGLVRRQATERDRREIRLELTVRGKRRFESIKGQVRKGLSEKVSVLSPGERRDLSKGLHVLRKVFQL